MASCSNIPAILAIARPGVAMVSLEEKCEELEAVAGSIEPDTVDGRTLDAAEFQLNYDSASVPAVIDHLADGWAALDKWTFEYLETSLAGCVFEVDHPRDHPDVPMVEYSQFAEYMATQRHDNPLYVFDCCMDDLLLADFQVPDLFGDDLMNLVPRDVGPPYRWFLVGPKRSGSSVHQDPLCTSAWNTVIRGSKRWFVCEPSVPKAMLVPPDGGSVSPHCWFRYHRPAIVTKLVAKGYRVYEFMLEQGQTVFVPAGWWHAVLNESDTIAVTQNFVSEANFKASWEATCADEEEVAEMWGAALEKHRPELLASVKKTADGAEDR